VHVAECQYRVGRPGWPKYRCLGIEFDELRIAVMRRIGGKLLVQGILIAACFATANRRLHGSNVVAVVMQQRRENLAVPAAAGSDFDHRLIRLDAEKLQGGLGMAIHVAGAVGWRAPGAGQYAVQLRSGEIAGAGRRYQRVGRLILAGRRHRCRLGDGQRRQSQTCRHQQRTPTSGAPTMMGPHCCRFRSKVHRLFLGVLTIPNLPQYEQHDV